MLANLDELLEAVCDEESFVAFLAALGADRADEEQKEKQNPSYASGANGWENETIEAFLEAATAWAEASKNGLPLLPKSTNPWRRCADTPTSGSTRCS